MCRSSVSQAAGDGPQSTGRGRGLHRNRSPSPVRSLRTRSSLESRQDPLHLSGRGYYGSGTVSSLPYRTLNSVSGRMLRCLLIEPKLNFPVGPVLGQWCVRRRLHSKEPLRVCLFRFSYGVATTQECWDERLHLCDCHREFPKLWGLLNFISSTKSLLSYVLQNLWSFDF